MHTTLDQGAMRMGNPLLAIQRAGPVDLARQHQPGTARHRQARATDRRRRHQRRHLQPHHLREGHRPLRALRPHAQRRRARRPRRARDLLQARVRGHPRGRRPAAPGLRRRRRPGRAHLVRAAAGARARRRRLDRGGQAHQGRDRPRERARSRCPRRAEGVEAFRELTAAGVSVNVTLLFAVDRYEEIANAWIDGLERRVAAGEPVDRLASVASFFVSRVDGKVDARLEELGRSELQGIAAVANAKLAYRSFQRIFSGPRWEALAAKGAHVQRPLWASTSTKNPSYPGHALRRHADRPATPSTRCPTPRSTPCATTASPPRTIDVKVDAAAEHMAELERIGVDLDRILDARARRRGRGVVREVVRLADRDDRREGARAGTGAGMSMAAEVARLFARDASLWTDSGEDAWLGWIDAVEEAQNGLAELQAWAGPLGATPRARRAVRHGRLEPGAARDRRAARLRAPARARLDRPRRRARRAGRGLAVRDRLQVGLDDRAQLLRGRVLGQDGRRRARASSRSPIPARRSRSARARTAGRTSRTAAPTSAVATPRSRRSGSCRRRSPGIDVAPLLASASAALAKCHDDFGVNPAATLATVIANAHAKGRDKLTFVMPRGSSPRSACGSSN